MNASASLPTSKFTSVIRRVLGNEALTRTPMDYCDSTSQREWICPTFIRTDSMPLQDGLTNDREKRYNFTHRPRSLMNVLHRPVETAVNSSHSKTNTRMAAFERLAVIQNQS